MNFIKSLINRVADRNVRPIRVDDRQRRVYEFEGIEWVHRPINLEQWSMLSQVFFDLNKDRQDKQDINELDLQAKLLAPEVSSRLMAILLVVEGAEFDPAVVDHKAETFRRFPAEWAMEVMRDFFVWNPGSGTILTIYLSTKILGGGSGKDHILDPANASSP